MKSHQGYALLALIMVLGILLHPFGLIANQKALLAKGPSVNESSATHTRLFSGPSEIFLPIIKTPPGPPAIQIIQPFDDGPISGMLFFAAQPANRQPITTVTFSANGTVIGTDSTPQDGWRVFLNANSLPAGAAQLVATATGPGGTTSESITVNVVPNPPSSGVINSSGGVLATAIDSVITFPPEAVPDGTFVSVVEKTQAEVTAETGIEWEDIGVTFLGAQDIQTNTTISKPLTVASAGFGNRVQPGQAVVNYQIIPDADGDGIDEIVVVNTATVAPNNDVISDPIPNVIVRDISISSIPNGITTYNQEGTDISVPLGAKVEFQVANFNPLSLAGNVAEFESLVDGTIIEFLGTINPNNSPLEQTFKTHIPPMLPIGPVRITLINKSTGQRSDSFEMNIEEPAPLAEPPRDIINAYYSDTINLVESTIWPEDIEHLMLSYLDQLNEAYSYMQNVYAAIDELPPGEDRERIEQSLVGIALILREYPIDTMRSSPSDDISDTLSDFSDAATVGGTAMLAFGGAMLLFPPTALAGAALMGGGRVLLIGGGLANWGKILNDAGDYWTSPTPSPNNCNNCTTGMGSAPPPGGNGCGNVGGGGGGSVFRTFSSPALEPGRFVIKIFSNGLSTPFTGLTDAGGYFFVPLIPAGEPFTAISIDTLTGDTRSFEGIGPEIGDSVYMFFDFFHEEEQPVSISWDGGGDGTSWSDPLNWDIDSIPTGGDRVLIDVPGNITVTHSTGNTSLISLQSEEVLNIAGGSLTVQATSIVNNNFAMGNRTNLTASGGGASFTVNGSGNINGANLFALNGGDISMPQITDYNGYTGAANTVWRATGPGSTLNFPGIVTLTGNTFANAGLHVEALDGGVINLSGLEDIDAGHVSVTADGTNSEIDLSALTSFVRTGSGGSTLRPINGGSILIDSLVNLDRVSLVLNGTGTMSTGQIITFTGGTVTVNGMTPDFSGMAMIDGSGFIAENGGDISMPQITDYNGYTGASNTPWRASGSGSTLNFPGIVTLTGNTFANAGLDVEALDGGVINLSGLEDIDAGHVSVTADGTNSEIDLSTLTSFVRTGSGGSTLRPINGGSILVDSLVNLDRVSLVLDGTGTMSTGQIITFTGGTATVNGMTPDFSGMAMIDGSGFIAENGAVISMPQITDYNGYTGASNTVWRASGPGSTLNLPGVTTLIGNTFVNASLGIRAFDGGTINLSGLANIDGGHTHISSDGTNSAVDLSALAMFTDTGNGSSSLTALNGGTMTLNSGTTTVQEVSVILESTGTLTVGTLTIGQNSILSGNGTITANIINSGTVSPGTSPGTINIVGSYVQTANGVLNIEIGGLSGGSQYDQLTLSGAVTLDGTLNLSLINGYIPNLGDTFTIIMANPLSGTFATVNGTSIGNGTQFEVNYDATSVTLAVIPE